MHMDKGIRYRPDRAVAWMFAVKLSSPHLQFPKATGHTKTDKVLERHKYERD